MKATAFDEIWLQPGGESGVANAGVVVDDDGITVIDTLMVRSQWEPFAAAVWFSCASGFGATTAAAVATPLENQFSTIAGLNSMSSSNSLGSTQITLQFNLSRNLDAAAQDVQSMIAKAARDLPQNLPSPPSYQKVNPADQPILYLSLSSPTLRLSDVDEYAETLMAQPDSAQPGFWRFDIHLQGEEETVFFDV